MSRTKPLDAFFAAGHFIKPNKEVVDLVISTGQRAYKPDGSTIGHFIIEIVHDDTAVHEVPFGSDHVKHPSVTSGVREPWSITTPDIQIHFGPTPADSVDAHVTSLAIGETVLYPAPATISGDKL